MTGRRRQRHVALVVLLAALSVVNLLDLVGVLQLGLGSVAPLAGSAVGFVFVVVAADRHDMLRLAFKAVVLFTLALVTMVVSILSQPDVGTHYAIYATTPGLVGLAVGQATVGAAVTLSGSWGVWTALEFVHDYRRLRATTPEERVLGDRR